MIFLSYFFLFHFIGFSQSWKLNIGFQASTENIKKFKIAKITIKSTATPNENHEYYFDNNGNDTASYIGGILFYFRKYEIDKQGKIIEWVQSDSNRIAKLKATYSYKNDGSYTISITHPTYKQITLNTVNYTQTGKIQNEIFMDGGQLIYKYDSQGKLLEISSKPGSDGDDQFTAAYTYNSNNTLISIKTIYHTDKYETLEKFYYNDKGILVKSETGVSYQSKKEKKSYTITYSYVFR